MDLVGVATTTDDCGNTPKYCRNFLRTFHSIAGQQLKLQESQTKYRLHINAYTAEDTA